MDNLAAMDRFFNNRVWYDGLPESIVYGIVITIMIVIISKMFENRKQ